MLTSERYDKYCIFYGNQQDISSYLKFNIKEMNMIIEELSENKLIKVDINSIVLLEELKALNPYNPAVESIIKIAHKMIENADIKESLTGICDKNVANVSLFDEASAIKMISKVKKFNTKKPEDTSSTTKKVKKVLKYLNKVSDSNYSHETATTYSLIKARIDDGASFDDFKLVIDSKVDEWFDDEKMRKYIRPATLFNATHFESYLQTAKINSKG
jgi:uncharacterized phage protein (TIGR02220 family)